VLNENYVLFRVTGLVIISLRLINDKRRENGNAEPKTYFALCILSHSFVEWIIFHVVSENRNSANLRRVVCRSKNIICVRVDCKIIFKSHNKPLHMTFISKLDGDHRSCWQFWWITLSDERCVDVIKITIACDRRRTEFNSTIWKTVCFWCERHRFQCCDGFYERIVVILCQQVDDI
jgi:hypothetical protein